MTSICIINVYFGKLPNYFDVWLKSASLNGTIDFMLVTDQEVESKFHNIKVIKSNLNKFSELASKKIGIDIKINTPYKLCDFKVTYGLVFEDYLNEYDFWGHCDLDLVWGDLRKFLTNELLHEYERILLWGHLSVYRNNNEVNRRFMLNGCLRGNYKDVLQSSKHFAFDESTGITNIYKTNSFSQFDGDFIAGISTRHKRFTLNEEKRNYPHQVFYFEKGHVFRAFITDQGVVDRDEFAYIHLHQRKFKDKNILKPDVDSYYITPLGFLEKKNNAVPSKGEIIRLNPYRGRFYEFLEKKKVRMDELNDRCVMRKSSRGYRYIHIVVQDDLKFLPQLINMFSSRADVFDFSEHLFITNGFPVANKFYSNPNVVFDNSSWHSIINDYGKKADIVILHSMIRPVTELLFVTGTVLKKIVWRTWGHDLRPLEQPNDLKGVYHFLLQHMLSARYKKFMYVGTGSYCDEILSNENFGLNNFFRLPYIYQEGHKGECSKLRETSVNEQHDTVRIMVGHSGLAYLNHEKITEQLMVYKNENIEVIYMLSYGVKEHIDYLKNYFLASALKDKIRIVTDFLPYDEYLKLLCTIDIAVFDQEGSAALGNVTMLLYLGKKLFLNKNGILNKEFLHFNLPCGYTEDIGRVSFQEFAKKVHYTKSNMDYLNEIMDEEFVVSQWKKLLNEKKF